MIKRYTWSNISTLVILLALLYGVEDATRKRYHEALATIVTLEEGNSVMNEVEVDSLGKTNSETSGSFD